MKFVVIGSGVSGSTAARLLTDAGHNVEMFDSREHIGGNCYDEKQGQVTVHKYGPHLFHTNDEAVWNFLSRFTEWLPYSHKVVADTARGRISIPYSLLTEEQIGVRLTDAEIRELIFVQYSEKQWGVSWEQLPDAIRNRIPARRDNSDDRYFTDRFQGQPKDGYTALFQRMLEGIPVRLGVPRNEWRKVAGDYDHVIYTGKIDEYFDCVYGKLPYRSLRFEHEKSRERLPHAVINQCNDLPFTRLYDHAYFLGEQPHETVITREFPQAHDDSNEPFYPMPFGAGMELYQKYKELARQEKNTLFLGRLATYSYLDMWMAVAQAMVKLKQQQWIQTL